MIHHFLTIIPILASLENRESLENRASRVNTPLQCPTVNLENLASRMANQERPTALFLQSENLASLVPLRMEIQENQERAVAPLRTENQENRERAVAPLRMENQERAVPHTPTLITNILTPTLIPIPWARVKARDMVAIIPRQPLISIHRRAKSHAERSFRISTLRKTSLPL